MAPIHNYRETSRAVSPALLRRYHYSDQENITSPPPTDSPSASAPSSSYNSQDKKKRSTPTPLRRRSTPTTATQTKSILPQDTGSNPPPAPSASIPTDSSDSRDKKKKLTTALIRRRQTASQTKSTPSSSALPQEIKGNGGVDPTILDPAVLDDLISRLVQHEVFEWDDIFSLPKIKPPDDVFLSEAEIRQLCCASREIFLRQPNLLDLKAPITICGDLHGQYVDLLRVFYLGGFPPSTNYLFLGDCVNYSKQSIETICLLLAYKIKYPDNLFLLRGCHGCASINRINGFYNECKPRYNVRIWKIFTDCFNCLPAAGLIDDKILCMHGGISPDLISLDQIRNLPRQIDVPNSGLLCDLLYSNPNSHNIEGWRKNNRGVSYNFGPEKVSEFLIKHDLDLICRAHHEFQSMVANDGYEFFAKRQLVTIFSRQNYGDVPNKYYDGATLHIDANLARSFQIFKPPERIWIEGPLGLVMVDSGWDISTSFWEERSFE